MPHDDEMITAMKNYYSHPAFQGLEFNENLHPPGCNCNNPLCRARRLRKEDEE